MVQWRDKAEEPTLKSRQTGIGNSQPDPNQSIRASLNQDRVDFLKSDLTLCFTFADFAATEIELRGLENAEKSIAHAEQGYETIRRLLSDPKHASHLTSGRLREFTAELKRLRNRLDGLKR